MDEDPLFTVIPGVPPSSSVDGQRSRIRRPVRDKDHGYISVYNGGCRCSDCCRAASAYRRRQRRIRDARDRGGEAAAERERKRWFKIEGIWMERGVRI